MTPRESSSGASLARVAAVGPPDCGRREGCWLAARGGGPLRYHTAVSPTGPGGVDQTQTHSTHERNDARLDALKRRARERVGRVGRGGGGGGATRGVRVLVRVLEHVVAVEELAKHLCSSARKRRCYDTSRSRANAALQRGWQRAARATDLAASDHRRIARPLLCREDDSATHVNLAAPEQRDASSSPPLVRSRVVQTA